MENVGVVGDLSKGCEGTDVVELDEVGENYENLKVKVISYTANKAEQSRGQKETAVPMELDYVSGSDMYDEEEWDDVDEVRRDRRCHNCGMMGHFARDCRTKGKGKGKGKDEGKGYGKGKGKTMKGTGRKGAGKSGTFQGRTRRTKRSRIPRTMLVVWQDRTQVVRMSMGS